MSLILLVLLLTLSLGCSLHKKEPALALRPIIFKNIQCENGQCWCGIAKDYGIDAKGNQVMWCTGEGK